LSGMPKYRKIPQEPDLNLGILIGHPYTTSDG
jgi:hypothetical protein